MFEVFRSPAAAERLAAAAAFIDRFPPATELLIVGASRDAADDLARRRAATRGATFGLHRASLLELAFQCAAQEMARRGIAPVRGLGAEALAARISFEAARDQALPYFMPVARFPGFAAALAATLGELRLARMTAAALGTLDGAGRDVAGLLHRFEAQLDEGKLADRAGLLLLAAGTVTESPLRRMPIVLLDVPAGDHAAGTFLDALTAVSPAVLVTVPSGDERTEHALGEIAARRGSALGMTGDAAPDEPSDLARARRYLFAPTAPPSRTPAGDVMLFSAPGEARETVEIARRLLDEARAGTRFDDMAVLLRAPETYTALLQAALERAGVPAYFARGSARPDPSGRAFLALLDCALEDLSARRFAEYLSLGQVPALDATGAPPTDRAVWVSPDDEEMLQVPEQPADRADGEAGHRNQPDADDQPVVDGTLRAPWKWEQLLVESAVIGSRDRWARRLAGLATEYRLKLADARASEPDAPRVAAIERDLANLEHLRRFALPVIDRLAALPVDGTWRDWIEALEMLAPMVLRRPERVLTVLAALRPLDVVGPIALSEVRGVLADELTMLAARPPVDRYGRVFIGAIEQARGRCFEVVFLPGLAERIFPQKPREDALLLDALRAQLGTPTPLATQTERAQRERLLLRLAVGATRRRLYISYSRIEQTEARPRVPSFYVLEMMRALTGSVPDPEAMARSAAAAAAAPLAWPAPDDPARAIDGVEHDLATLRALLGGSRAHGRARYLFELNECLMRSLRTQYARWQQRRFTPYDGIVRVADGTRDTLGAARLGARAYSASALQKFAACPYQFFLSAILRIEPRSEIESITQLDPATRGHLFHRVQADAMRTLAAEGRLPLTGGTLHGAHLTLDRTLDAVAERYREELAPAIGRVWQDEIESMRADLHMWLQLTAEGHATWEPVAFELAFGLRADEGNDPQSVETEVTLETGARLRGIVDLVERKASGTELRVTDYKTGGNWTRRGMVIGGGEQLQPVLYGLAMEQVLGARVVESRLFFCTRTGRFSDAVVPLTSDARRRGLQVLGVIDRAIAAGFLPPAPRQRACGICDFRAVCGPWEETRVTRKDAARLESLHELRGWP